MIYALNVENNKYNRKLINWIFLLRCKSIWYCLKSIKIIWNFLLVKCYQFRRDLWIIISHEILKANHDFGTVSNAVDWSDVEVSLIVCNSNLTVLSHVGYIPGIKNSSCLSFSNDIFNWVNFSDVFVSNSFINQNICSVSI